ncbi:hypothetical protein OTU49_015888 [Cherax quadricarinatus]|uniref:Uncharacterized protein n=1 Tax=Cherax quadricarinatus TaxID=27406 RepID=A0AAW0Y9F3_CHEQU
MSGKTSLSKIKVSKESLCEINETGEYYIVFPGLKDLSLARVIFRIEDENGSAVETESESTVKTVFGEPRPEMDNLPLDRAVSRTIADTESRLESTSETRAQAVVNSIA